MAKLFSDMAESMTVFRPKRHRESPRTISVPRDCVGTGKPEAASHVGRSDETSARPALAARRAQGRAADGRWPLVRQSLRGPAYAWFNEGFDARALQHAKALLETRCRRMVSSGGAITPLSFLSP
jgi:hypothetical protein